MGLEPEKSYSIREVSGFLGMDPMGYTWMSQEDSQWLVSGL